MANYTIEDIEILRKKSGVTYEEAVNLLEYHNGSLARSLVDLERNGRLGGNGKKASGGEKGSLLAYLYRFRMTIRKGSLCIVNISVLAAAVALIAAPYVVGIGLLLALTLGYRIRFVKNSEDFSEDQIDRMIRSAKNTVQRFTRQEGEKDGEAPRASGPASGSTPVNVQFPRDGSVNVREGQDGYHEADIQ